jgi:hypothetical protein
VLALGDTGLSLAAGFLLLALLLVETVDLTLLEDVALLEDLVVLALTTEPALDFFCFLVGEGFLLLSVS